MEVAPGVHSIPAPAPAFMGVYAPNVYLVTAGKAAFVDSGYAVTAPVRLDYVKEIGAPPVAYVILTHAHPDHAGGAGKIKAATGAAVLAHLQEISPASVFTTVDRGLRGGEVIGLGEAELEVIHTPGHSPGHICLYLKNRKVLFSGDHVPGMGTTAISPATGNMAEYIDSLRKLLQYDLSLICPAHGPVIHHSQRKIQELLQHRLEREEQVLNCLKQGKSTPEEMVQEIYPELDQRLHGMAIDQVLAHLVKLERESRVLSQPGQGRREYALK